MNDQFNTKKLAKTIGNQYYGIGTNGNKSLSINYLENSLSIGIHSELNEVSSSGQRYDYKSGNIIYLTGKKSKALARLLVKARAALEKDEDIGTYAISSATNLIEVSDGTKFGLDKGITLTIYNNVNENKTSDSYCVFQFRNEDIITDYDYKTGSYGKSSLDTDVDYFIDNLKEFSKAWCNANAHFVKKELDFSLDRIVNRQLQCMEALGIKLETPRSVRLDWTSNSYNNGKTQHVSNTDELLSELDNL